MESEAAGNAEQPCDSRSIAPTIAPALGQDPTMVPALSRPALVAKGGLAKLRAAYATDKDLENNGAWMTVAEGIRWRIRSQMSNAARLAARRIADEYKAVYATGTMTLAQEDEQELELAATALVTDWDGDMTDDNGQPLACTDKSVRLVCGEMPHLRRAASRFSLDLSNYRAKS